MRFLETPIGAAFDVRNGATPSSGVPSYWDGNIPWITPADLGRLKSRFVSKGSRSITHDGYISCGTQMVPEGSVILSTRAPIGHLAIASQSMCVNQGCRGLIPRKVVRTDFGYWSLLAHRPKLEAAGRGSTFIELGRGILRAERIPLPDLDTQKNIADFLDRETSRIDQLIEKKLRLVELVDEKRSALITAAVTGQIDPKTGRQRTVAGSGRVKLRLRRCVTVGTRKSHFNPDLGQYIGLEHITSWTGQITHNEKETPEGLVTHFEKGDLLFGKLRPYLAKVASPDFSGVCSTEAFVLKPSKSVSLDFLRYCISTPEFIDRVNAATFGAKMPRASWENLGAEYINLPDLPTQQTIADFLDRKTVRIDTLNSKTHESIDRLREFRAALITAAVTGQIDVTTWSKEGQTNRDTEKIEEVEQT